MRKQNFLKTGLLFSMVAILSFFTLVQANAQTPQADSSGIQFEFQAGLAKFSMDGRFDNGDFGFGINYHTPQAVIEPGLFLTSNIELESGDKEELLQLGVMLQALFKQTLAVGIYYDFWKTNKGLDGWRRDNSGFTVSYNFNF